MNLYGIDYSLFDLDLADASLIESISSSHAMITDRRHRESEEENLLKISSSILKNIKRNSSPPKRRHDGTSPLPLGMDWSPPPRNWDGTSTIWPHDFHAGWSYCVTVPSWSIFEESKASKPVVFYRVQIGLQSPEGVTTTHGVLRRFSDFLKLSSDLKQSFRNKKLPPAPPKGILRTKDRTLMEERRCSLEDWMAKVLSDIDFSRSAPIAWFLELEVAARSFFCQSSHQVTNVDSSCNSSSSADPLSSHTDVSMVAGTSALASNYNNGSTHETSDIQSDLYVKDNYSEFDKGNPISDNYSASHPEATANEAFVENNNATLSKEFIEGKEENYLQKLLDGRSNLVKIDVGASYALPHHRDSVENSPGLKNSPMISHDERLLRESPPKGACSATPHEISDSCAVHLDSDISSKSTESIHTSIALETLASSDLQFSPDSLVVLSLDEQQKMKRLLSTIQQRLVTSRTDIEDLIARLNQELAVRQYLTTKVKDLETELESTKHIGQENLKHTLFIERERFTEMQWDMEELRRNYTEMEFRLKAEQEQNAHAEATKLSLVKENEALRQELDSAREQLKNLQKCHEETNLKSKSDIKLLVVEVKSLRSSQSELRMKLDRVSKDRMELETRLEKERTKRECIDAANRKLLRECEILRSRLEECSVDFLVEQENKLQMAACSPPDALDILATSENRIGLLLAEAQLLAQDVATPLTSHESDDSMTTGDEMRKVLTDVLIDNAILRKHANSTIRHALNMTNASSNSSQTIKEDAT